MPRFKGSDGCYNKHDAREFGLAAAVVWNDVIDRAEQFDAQKIWYDQKMASDRLGIPQQTISRSLQTLQEAGRIKTEGGYRPKSSVRTTWITIADEYLDDNLITQNGYPKVTQNEYPILKETEERDSEEETQTQSMRPEVLYSRVHSMFKGPHEMRKQKIEAIRHLKDEYQLSDDTILTGFRAIADNPTFTAKDTGEEITWNLSMLLLRKDLERTAALLVQKSEQTKNTPAKIKGMEHYMKFGDM